MNIDMFSNQNLLDSIDYLYQFIQIKITLLKDLKLEDIIYQKESLKITTLLSMEENFYDQPIDCDIRSYEGIRK